MKKPQWTDDEKYSICFNGVAIGVAEKYAASVNSAEADEFMKALWQRFKAAGIATPDMTWITGAPPSEVDAWLDVELRNEFPAPNGRPVWIEMPDWRFHNSEPMTYLGCVTSDMHSAGETIGKRYVYVFEGKTPSELGGHELVYKMTIQDSTAAGTSRYG